MRRAWPYLLFALIAPVLLLVIATGGAAQPVLTEGTPTAIGRGGAVATVETLASEAAVDVVVRAQDSFVSQVLGIESRWGQLLALAGINVVVWLGESGSEW